MLLADCADLEGHAAYLERAIAESENEPALRAVALAARVMLFALIRVERIADAENWATEGLPDAWSARPQFERRVLNALAWTRVLQGLPITELEARFPNEPDGTSLYEVSIERAAGVRHAFRGEVNAARSSFNRLLALADERGESISGEVINLQLCELALRAGDVHAARQALDVWDEWGLSEGFAYARVRCLALLAAVTGDRDEAKQQADVALGMSGAGGWDRIEVRRALGLIALLDHSPEAALEHFGSVWEHIQREGVEDPGAFPVAADLVQALMELDRTGEALEVTERLRTLSEAPRSSSLAHATRRGRPTRSRRPRRHTAGSACASIKPGRSCCSAAFGGATRSGAPRATRSSRRRRCSTRAAAPDGPTWPALSSTVSAPGALRVPAS
jgi:hypothetical protein